MMALIRLFLRSGNAVNALRSVSRRGVVMMSMLVGAVGWGSVTATSAYTSADAEWLFEAHSRAFYRETNGVGWHAQSTEGGRADFWMQAEQLEMVLDAYERFRRPKHLTQFTHLFRGFVSHHSCTWEKNEFNDDILWMVIACARGHLLTGDPEFLEVARLNYDLCYQRAWSTNLGGGLWWKTDHRSKNACVNGPGAIAAFLLGRATGQNAYKVQSTNLFLWLRSTLFEPETGKVYDSISAQGELARFSLTYNQGTFVGAANKLGYVQEARKAALYTRDQLCRDGFLPAYDENGDGGGFNGIGVRWIAEFMNERGEKAMLEPWLQKNAEAAWQARRDSDGLSWCRWPKKTPEGRRYSWGCSSAVVLMQVTMPTEVQPPAAP